jgi:hypothetical protein
MQFHRPRATILLAALATVLLVCAQPAAADENVPGLTASEEEVLGEDITATEDGLYEVEVPGADLITHGPDPARLATRSSVGGVGFQAGDEERAPACASDYYQHILYARAPGAADRLPQVRGQLQAAIRRMNAVLNSSAIANGGVSADYKVLCDSAGNVQIDGFVATGKSFDDIVDSARAAGADAPNADYTIFFDGDEGNACGVGSYIDDERLVASNASNQGGGYAVVYRDCWFTDAAMHENGHAQGAVQYSSPNSTGSGGHCNDESDVMCYSPDGGNLRQGGTVTRCDGGVQFDCGGDDYFDPKPEAGEWLSSHWNLGSPLNKFMRFSDASPNEPGTGGGGGGGGGLIDSVVGGVTNVVTSIIGKPQATSKSAPQGQWQYFKARVRRGVKLLHVSLPVPQAVNLDLFARSRQKPTQSRFACSSATNGRTEDCTVRRPRAGTWMIGVYTYSGTAGVPFTVKVSRRR